jgi:Ca2+/Na+ antiporter
MNTLDILSIFGGILGLIVISMLLYFNSSISIILIDIVILVVILVLYIIYIVKDDKLEKIKTDLDDKYITINEKINSLNREYNKL